MLFLSIFQILHKSQVLHHVFEYYKFTFPINIRNIQEHLICICAVMNSIRGIKKSIVKSVKWELLLELENNYLCSLLSMVRFVQCQSWKTVCYPSSDHNRDTGTIQQWQRFCTIWNVESRKLGHQSDTRPFNVHLHSAQNAHHFAEASCDIAWTDPMKVINSVVHSVVVWW